VQPQNPQNAQPELMLFGAAIATVNRGSSRRRPTGEHCRTSTTVAGPSQALAEELQRAVAKPKSVAHPELVDPDVYWQRSLWPQASAVVKAARTVLVEVAAQLQPTIPAAEAGDAGLVELAGLRNPTAPRRGSRARARSHRGRDRRRVAKSCITSSRWSGVLRPPLDAIERLQERARRSPA
jgi:hypothetical protein